MAMALGKWPAPPEMDAQKRYDLKLTFMAERMQNIRILLAAFASSSSSRILDASTIIS